MKNNFTIKHRDIEFSFVPPREDQSVLGFHLSGGSNGSGVRVHTHFCGNIESDVVSLALLYKALGYALSMFQPGYLDPLPEGDENEVDAMKLDHEVRRLWREGNAND